MPTTPNFRDAGSLNPGKIPPKDKKKKKKKRKKKIKKDYSWFHGKVDEDIIDNMVELIKADKIKGPNNDMTRSIKDIKE